MQETIQITTPGGVTSFPVGSNATIAFQFRVFNSKDAVTSYEISVNWGPVAHTVSSGHLKPTKNNGVIQVVDNYACQITGKCTVIVTAARMKGGWCGRGQKELTILAKTVAPPPPPAENPFNKLKLPGFLDLGKMMGDFADKVKIPTLRIPGS